MVGRSRAMLTAIEDGDEEASVKPRKSASGKIDILELLDDGNIVDEFSNACGQTILDEMNTAEMTMADWKQDYEKALRLAKLKPKEKNKTFPFEGASTAMTPYILEAMVDFNARTSPELAYSDNIVKAKITGGQKAIVLPPPPQDLPPELAQQAQQAFDQTQAQVNERQDKVDADKQERADRVAEFTNYQLSRLIPTWRKRQDNMLMSLPCVGTMYKETFYDYDLGAVNSKLCFGDQVIFNQDYETFEDAPDYYKHLPDMSRNEVVEKIRGEEAWDLDEDKDLSGDDKEMYSFCCAWTWVDLDDDGLKEPYQVVIKTDTAKIVYARPCFDEDTITYSSKDESQIAKIERIRTFTQFQFLPDPEGSPMGMGWGILLGKMFEEINSAIRRQLDAGTLQIIASNSGLIAIDSGGGRGNSAQKGAIEMAMGKLTPVNVRGGTNLSQNVVQFPAAGMSPQMFQLTEYMVETARRLTDASSQAEANPNEAAALYLARLNQTLKRPNVITMRVYDAAAKEFELIHELNHKHFSDELYNKVIDDTTERSMKADFNPDDCDIQLVADPSQGSDIERIARVEAVLQNAKTEMTPITDMRQATKDYYEVIGADAEMLVPEPTGKDPMTLMMEKQQQLEEREMQLDAAREAVDADIKQEDQKLKIREQDLKAKKLEADLAEASFNQMMRMKEADLNVDSIESQITERYTKSMKNLFDMGISQPMQQLHTIEEEFIQEFDYDPSTGELIPRG